MKIHRFILKLALALLASLSLAALLVAQSSNASITGAVADSSGAAISGAELTLDSIDTSSTSKATSDADGVFSFPNLPQGNYELRVSAKGFKDYIQKGILLHLNDNVRLPV